MAVYVQVNLDPVEMDLLLNDPIGPVGVVIAELSQEATAVAKAGAPVMKPSHFSHWGKMFDPRFQYGPPGETKRSVHWSGFRFNPRGQLYSGVNVNFGPTFFLEYGGGRRGHALRHPFMSVALDTVEL